MADLKRLTGRTRYRITWLGRLVLQVELRSPAFQVKVCGLSATFREEVTWRDAKTTDFVGDVERGSSFHRALKIDNENDHARPPTER